MINIDLIMTNFTRKFLLLILCLMMGICAKAGITVSGSNGTYVLTVSTGTTASDWTGLSSDVKTATSITIVTSGGYELTSTDVSEFCGDWSIASVFTKVTTLNLENADVATDNVEDTNTNDLWKLKRLVTLKELTFPKSTVYIPAQCLQGNGNVEEIIIPNNTVAGTMTLCSQCFSQMTALKKVVIGSAAGTFVNQTFQGSTVLQYVEFQPGVTTIGDGAFQGCTGITSIILPESVTSIGQLAFEYTNIESIRLPNTLKTIGNCAFDQCHQLKSVTIPASVETIETGAFQHNWNLTDVYVLGTTTKCAADAFAPESTYNGVAASADRKGTTVNSSWFKYNGTEFKAPAVLHYPTAAKNYYVNKAFTAFSQYTLTDANGDIWPNPDNISSLVDYFAHPDYLSEGNTERKYDGTSGYNQSDYYGWNNFMLITSTVEQDVWPEKRITEDRWYSMVFPFAMTQAQIEGAFGAGTEVCEFSKVATSTTTENGTTINTITLYFSDDVTSTAAHHPYMIHPSVKTTATTTGGELIGNTIAGVDKTAAIAAETGASMVTVTKDGYDFIGSYGVTESTLIPKYSYYLGGGTGTGYEIGFYRMMNDDSSRTWGYWTKYTAIVEPQTKSDASAKYLPVCFGTQEDNTITRIDVVAGEVDDNTTVRTVYIDKVFNMQGQVVREGTSSLDGLDKGIYIVNGKKYVVR